MHLSLASLRGDALWQDIRWAARGLIKTPGFTVLAALTLALGVGANTAIFSVVRGVVLEPLPYERPEEIVRVWPERRLSKEMLVAFEEASSFSSVSGYHGVNFTLTGDGEPEELSGLAVAPGHFAVLGTRPAFGRRFEPADREPGAEPVVILSHGLWQARFGADPRILGRSIAVDGLGHNARTVVGVLPEDFTSVVRQSAQLWTPLTFDIGNPDDYRDMLGLRALARLSPGTSQEQATAEVKTIAGRLQQAQPSYHTDEQVRTASVMPLHEVLTGSVRSTLWMLLGAVGLVLLIGCSNVANMLLARAGDRRREMAVRSALGAGRGRLIRQLLTESALLGLLGGGIGLLSAVWLESFLVNHLPASLPRAQTVGIGQQELIFAGAVSLLAAVIFGLVPAWRAVRSHARHSLAADGRPTAGPGSHRLNQGLVTAEVALSVILVVAAGLMLKSLWRLNEVEPGFTPEKVLTLRLSPPTARYGDAARLSGYYTRVLERLEAVPGVDSAGAINLLPMTTANLGVGYSTEDHPPTADAPGRMVSLRIVAPGYFETLGVPLIAGRPLAASDRDGTESVGMINRAMAEELWPGRDAVGKRILWDDGSPWFTVAGVVGDVRQHRLELEAAPEVYLPFAQAFTQLFSPAMFLTVRTAGDPTALIPATREAVWSVDADVPISRAAAMPQVIETSLSSQRLTVLLLSCFGVLALLLGAVGVYGVGSYTVSRRTREIGVRMALGARRATMLRSVMVRELIPVVAGIALGTAGALAATRLLASSLYGVAASDPLTYATVALVLGAVAIAASYLPARRAAQVDPIVALRSE